MTAGYAWVDEVDMADTFMDRMTAEGYLARKRGEFWRDAKVVAE